jgi:hypothetical protein
MANVLRRASTGGGSDSESSLGTSYTTSKVAGGGTTGDLMCFLWITFTAGNVASNNNGYTQQWENVINGARVSLWTKTHSGSETGTMTWTMDTGWDDGGYISFSVYNHDSSNPISGSAFASDTSGPVYTCPDVTQDGTSEMLIARILAADDQDVRGDDNSTVWAEVQVFAQDTATGGALTLTGATAQTSVGTYNFDTTTQGGGTSAAQTITVVFVSPDSIPAADQIGDIAISMGAAF